MGEDFSTYVDEDIRLMTETAEGQREAYARLYQKYRSTVTVYIARRQACPKTCEDLTQEVFTRIWELRKRYRPGTSPKTYMLGFARNILKEHHAKTQAISKTKQDYALEAILAEDDAPQDVVIQVEQAEKIQEFMHQLPTRQRQTLELVYLEGLSSLETARILGCSPNTVRSTCFVAFRKLIAWLKKYQ